MEPINIQAELANYRKAYGLVGEELKKNKEAEASVWAMEQSIPQGNVMPGWGSRIDLPEETPNYFDERVSGDPAIDEQSFQQYLGEHPFSTEEGDKMVEMIQELSEMVKDPENPMTLEDAMAEYTSRFSTAFDEWEQGAKNV